MAAINPSYSEFKKIYLGHSVDVDGYPVYNIYQCWDLVSGKYFPYIGGKTISCNKTQYVIDIATERKTNGILDFCIDVGLKEPLQPGDICIWAVGSPSCPLSHIAIYDHDNGQDEVYFLGQNQPYNKVTIQQLSVKGIVGVFRPKIFVKQKPSKPAKKADQILTEGSICESYGFIVEGLRWNKSFKRWEMKNSWVGGWFPTAFVHEVDKKDGRMDNILHIGSGVAFDGPLHIDKVDVKRNTAHIKEFNMDVYSRCLMEIKDGK